MPRGGNKPRCPGAGKNQTVSHGTGHSPNAEAEAEAEEEAAAAEAAAAEAVAAVAPAAPAASSNPPNSTKDPVLAPLLRVSRLKNCFRGTPARAGVLATLRPGRTMKRVGGRGKKGTIWSMRSIDELVQQRANGKREKLPAV